MLMRVTYVLWLCNLKSIYYLGRAKRSPSLLGGAKPEAMVRRNRMVRPSKPDGTAVETGWYDRTSGRGLPLARDRSAAEPPAPRFTAILADTAELSHCQERPGLVNLPIGLQGQHC